MPLLGTLVFLCSCLHPYPCMLDFANVVDLLLEYTCLHTEVECVPFEAETDRHDNCLTAVVDCVLMVDTSLRLKCGHSHTCGRQSVSVTVRTKLSYFAAGSGQESDGILVVQSLQIPME